MTMGQWRSEGCNLAWKLNTKHSHIALHRCISARAISLAAVSLCLCLTFRWISTISLSRCFQIIFWCFHDYWAQDAPADRQSYRGKMGCWIVQVVSFDCRLSVTYEGWKNDKVVWIYLFQGTTRPHIHTIIIIGHRIDKDENTINKFNNANAL